MAQVYARIRPGDAGSDHDLLLLPLRQRLKLRKKGDKIAHESFGLPVKAVRELLEAGVLEAGADLPPELVRALAEAAALDQAADQSLRDAMRPAHDKEADEAQEAAVGRALEAVAEQRQEAAARSATLQGEDEGEAGATTDKSEDDGVSGARSDLVPVHKRRHGAARLLSVQPSKAVMFIPGQGFRPFVFHQCFDNAVQVTALPW
jgi:hypothetical protein